MNKSKIIAAVVSVAAAIVFCLFLFFNSAQDAITSTQISNIFVRAIIPVLTFFGIVCDELTVSFYVRKSAHFLGYFALSMLIYAALTRFVSKKKALVIAPTVTLAIAVFDEFVIQRISSGRSPEWRDVIIDLCGALLATAILSLRFFLKSKKEEGKNDNA